MSDGLCQAHSRTQDEHADEMYCTMGTYAPGTPNMATFLPLIKSANWTSTGPSAPVTNSFMVTSGRVSPTLTSDILTRVDDEEEEAMAVDKRNRCELMKLEACGTKMSATKRILWMMAIITVNREKLWDRPRKKKDM